MKKLLVVLFIITMIFCFVGCDMYDKRYDASANEFMGDIGFVIIERLGNYGDTYVYLVYDAETKVEYIFTRGYSENSLCPYYDENGEVTIYKGE